MESTLPVMRSETHTLQAAVIQLREEMKKRGELTAQGRRKQREGDKSRSYDRKSR